MRRVCLYCLLLYFECRMLFGVTRRTIKQGLRGIERIGNILDSGISCFVWLCLAMVEYWFLTWIMYLQRGQPCQNTGHVRSIEHSDDLAIEQALNVRTKYKIFNIQSNKVATRRISNYQLENLKIKVRNGFKVKFKVLPPYHSSL